MEIVFLTIVVHSLSTVECQLLHYLDKTLLSIDDGIVKKDAILITCFTLAKDASASVQQEQLGHIQVGWGKCLYQIACACYLTTAIFTSHPGQIHVLGQHVQSSYPKHSIIISSKPHACMCVSILIMRTHLCAHRPGWSFVVWSSGLWLPC